MSRRMLIAAFAVSTATLVVTLVAWLMSYHHFTMRAHQGKLSFICTNDRGILGGFAENNLGSVNTFWKASATSQAQFAGVDFYHLSGLTVLGVPFVYLVAILMVCSALCGARIRRQRRRARLGLCLDCGYDLRQSNGRCPECGMTAATPAVETGHGG